jgi:hypothetical protein
MFQSFMQIGMAKLHFINTILGSSKFPELNLVNCSFSINVQCPCSSHWFVSGGDVKYFIKN